MRWRLQLEEHDHEIVYKPGTTNLNADALSRIAQVTSSPKYNNSFLTYEKYIEDVQSKLITNSNVIEIEGDLL